MSVHGDARSQNSGKQNCVFQFRNTGGGGGWKDLDNNFPPFGIAQGRAVKHEDMCMARKSWSYQTFFLVDTAHLAFLLLCFFVLFWSAFCRRMGAGIAQWLEHRTRDWKVAGSNPCWNGGRIFFSRVDFLCWLLFRYPFHPCVTTVARKKSRSFCQKCRWQVTAKHAYTLRMWILLNRASALVTTCP